MKAFQLIQPRNFEIVDVPVPIMDIDNTERILVRTRWASLCGSDISFFNGTKRDITYPLAPGVPNHENVGQVVESQSKEFRPGDLVLAIPEGDGGLAEYCVAKPFNSIHRPDYAMRNAQVMVCENAKGEVTILYKKETLSYTIFQKSPHQADVVDTKTLDRQIKTTKPPPANHPWRHYGSHLNGIPIDQVSRIGKD
jgi:NADPH-dependent curcumin reductase CurA